MTLPSNDDEVIAYVQGCSPRELDEAGAIILETTPVSVFYANQNTIEHKRKIMEEVARIRARKDTRAQRARDRRNFLRRERRKRKKAEQVSVPKRRQSLPVEVAMVESSLSSSSSSSNLATGRQTPVALEYQKLVDILSAENSRDADPPLAAPTTTQSKKGLSLLELLEERLLNHR